MLPLHHPGRPTEKGMDVYKGEVLVMDRLDVLKGVQIEEKFREASAMATLSLEGSSKGRHKI